MEVTVEMINNIPAGRELDALVAEYVLGIKKERIVLGPASEERDWGSMGVVLTAPVEAYSQRMGSAWAVVEHMKQREEAESLNAIWWNFWQSGRVHIWELDAADAAARICRAALATVAIAKPSYAEFFDTMSRLMKTDI
jgi:hypothetical protein